MNIVVGEIEEPRTVRNSRLSAPIIFSSVPLVFGCLRVIDKIIVVSP